MKVKKDIQIHSFRGDEDVLNNLSIKIGEEVIKIETGSLRGQFNVKCLFEKTSKELTYSDSTLGKVISQQNLGVYHINAESQAYFRNNNLVDELIDLKLDCSYHIGMKVFLDEPVHHYKVLDALTIPINILTIYVYFSESEVSECTLSIQKYFDAYSHLGFFLADLEKMKCVIEREYGNINLDLVHEFSNSDIIDKLFEEEIIMIVWGINPYVYPIYSCENPDDIIPLIGKKLGINGIFNIDEEIEELSLVPGHELRNYPSFINKNWEKIKLWGKGKKTYLRPYALKDADLEIVLTSFLIQREVGHLEESKPLMNVDLLYS